MKAILINRTIGGLLLGCLFLTSCRVTEAYKRPEAISDATLYRDHTATDSATIAAIPWQQLFTDPVLQQLINEGIQKNFDLEIAMARIRQAEATLRQSKAAFYPSLQGNATATAQKLATSTQGASQYFQLYGNTSWEADIWGKLASTKRASLAAVLQSDAYKRAVQTQLVSDIATNYYGLMALDAQLQITLKTRDNRIKDVATMKLLKESNVVTGAAVVQSEANRYSAEVTLPDLRQDIRESENALSLLLGRSPGAIVRDSLNTQQLRTDLPIGIPAQLLANRPDVQEAEYQLRYYFEMTNTAKTYFYPSLTITAQGGLSDEKLSDFFNTSTLFGNIIGGLTQPIFNKGLNKQRLEIAKAQQQEYLATLKKTLLIAGNEVSNALYDYEAASEKITIRTQQLLFLQKSVDYTKALLKYTANTNYTDVLTSEQSLLAAQLSSISDRLQQLQAVVDLYRSLGGGWR